MKSMNWILFTLSLAAAAPVLAWDRDVPVALRPYMTAEEFRAAGLHKLNPAELAQFQAWFVRTVGERPPADTARNPAPAERPPVATAPAASDNSASRFGVESMRDDLDRIVAVAEGSFEGWMPGTVFELDNGQAWEVIDSPRFRFLRELTDPTVTIERGSFGAYRLKVEGYNRWANVHRIK